MVVLSFQVFQLSSPPQRLSLRSPRAAGLIRIQCGIAEPSGEPAPLGQKTRYNDGIFEKAFMTLFARKMERFADPPGKAKEKKGWWDWGYDYESFVDVSRRVMQRRSRMQQQQVVREVLLSMLPPGAPAQFRKLFPPTKWAAEFNAALTVPFFHWLVGPSEDPEAEQTAENPSGPDVELSIEKQIRQSPEESANPAIPDSLVRQGNENPFPEVQSSAPAMPAISIPLPTQVQTATNLETQILSGASSSSQANQDKLVQTFTDEFDINILMAKITPSNPPLPSPTNPTFAEAASVKDTKVDLDELISMLSGSHKSSHRSARSSTQPGQDSSDSHVTELLAELKNAFIFSFEHLISDQPLQERMTAIVTELEPLSQQLPIASRALPITVKDFLQNLSLNMPSIHQIIPAYDKKVQEKSRILKQLTNAKNEIAKLKDHLVKGKNKEAELGKEIEDLEKRLEETRHRRQNLSIALQHGSANQ